MMCVVENEMQHCEGLFFVIGSHILLLDENESDLKCRIDFPIFVASNRHGAPADELPMIRVYVNLQ